MSRNVRPVGPPRPTLIAAGCDPALPLLEAPLGLLDPPVAFSWWPCPSREALRLAAAGFVHVAGTHLRGLDSEYNITPAADLLREGGEAIGFCSWREGLVLRPELAGRISGLQDVAGTGLRLVNREPGAEARSLLDRKLADAGIDVGQLPGYDTQADGHLQVAAAIAAGLADAGIASEPAALAYDLVFIPLAAERFDLVIPAGQVSSREVQGLLKVLTSAWLLDQLASLPGYDPGRCGEPIATLPPRHRGMPLNAAASGSSPAVAGDLSIPRDVTAAGEAARQIEAGGKAGRHRRRRGRRAGDLGPLRPGRRRRPAGVRSRAMSLELAAVSRLCSPRASPGAACRDGADWPDSTAEAACRDTPAMAASCSRENPRACRASRSRAPFPPPCPSP